ncbi:MAG: tRNA lysidine(34) synthetase TilS, partial [Bacteroidota bacterium]
MLLEKVKSFVDQKKLFSPKEKILLAVSGGIDSVCMAVIFSKAQYSFSIAHCNFQLRGEESELDEVFVRKLAELLNVPFYSKKFLTTDYADDHRLSIQMAARELRYQWFNELREREKFNWIATAHHHDDVVETFFINMMRSSGISGFHGILPKKDKLIRPLLFASREEIVSFIKENRIEYREDKSNLESKYLRNRIRHQVLPVLKEIN